MVDVLVVGAGPSGLTAALDLARRGLKVRIIDKASGPSPHSRAVGVQSGCLRALEAAFGAELPQKLVAQGTQVKQMVMHLDGHEMRIPVEIEGTYPYVLCVNQTYTEGALRDALLQAEVKVEYGTEALGMEQNHRVIVTLAGGERVEAAFILGCDGAHSFVRHACDLPFTGDPYVGDFLLADVEMTWPDAPDAIHTFVTTRGVVASFPMAGGRNRFIVLRDKGAEGDPTEAEFNELVSAISGKRLQLRAFAWLSHFRTHHRLAKHWRKGRAFLVGDAAHIHSPVGGQGMNTGIQDALVLVPAIHHALRTKDLSRLDVYEHERRKQALKIVRGTDFVFRQAVTSHRMISRVLRQKAMATATQLGFVRRLVARSVAQVESSKRVIALRRELDR